VSEDESPKVDPPDPRPENLQKLAKRVDSEDADLGLAFDLDADRIRVYRDGEFVSGDEVFAILASETDRKTVASVNTASEIENMTEVEYTRVGDPFVLDRALEIDAELAGEPNGHYAFPEFLPYNSAALTALILSRIDLKKTFGQLEDFEIARESLKVESKEKVIEELKEIHGDEIVSEVDGIKFGMEDSTVLVRPSGSSSKVRITADSGGEASAERILEEVKEEVKSIETQ
jgi:phosphoglucosamine mutase